MSLQPPPKVRKLREALHAKAKGSPTYRFYALYDKVYREDVLAFAYRCCKANGGAAGVDNQEFADVESYGLKRWLGELAEELRSKTYRPQKTHVCRLPDESFDLVGYTIGRCYSPKTGRAYIGTRPSPKKIQRLNRRTSELTSCRWELLDHGECVRRLNRVLVGWANYFFWGSVSRAYRAVDAHARHRLRRWLRRKHKVPGRGTARFPLRYIYDTLGLIEFQLRPPNFPRAKA